MGMHVDIAFIGGSMSGGEILLVLLAALVLFGSKNLPSIARNIGKSMETFRRASREVTDEIMRADLKDAPATPPRRTEPARVPPSAAPAEDDEQPTITVRPAAQAVDRHDPPASAS